MGKDLGLGGMSPGDWIPDGLVYGAEDYEEDDTAGGVRFNLPVRYLRLRQELMQNPKSRYFGIFKTEGDFWRHIVINGLLKLAEGNSATKEEATGLRLREEGVALAARNKTIREKMVEVVEPVIRSVGNDIAAGDLVSAGKFLDEFLGRVLMIEDERVRRGYIKTLLDHPSFARSKLELIEVSELLPEVVG